MLMYSDGGVMATKAFDAITLTLYIGLADNWSRGGRKEDNVLARAHESRLNSFPPLCTNNLSSKFVIKKKKEKYLLCCVLHTRL